MHSFEGGPNFSELNLTKVEKHQAKSRSIRPGDELAYIKYFKSNPEKRDIILDKPFSNTNEQMSKFNNEEKWIILRSAIIAEPEGSYEQNYSQLARGEQLQKLYDQIDSSAQMTIRIQKYIEDNLSNINSVSDEELYKELCDIAFASEDENVIQTQYALSQRRGFRLSIINFLEGRNKLSPYRLESSENPKAFAEKYLKNTFTGNVTVEQLPIGFVIYLDEQDYALIESDDKSPKSIPSKGVNLLSNWLPEELQGKIILINSGGEESGLKSADEFASTRGHEIRHVIFRDFHAQQSETDSYNTREALMRCKTEQDYRQVSETVYMYFIERAKDEIIAYFSQGKFDESYSALGFPLYRLHIEQVETALKQRTDLPENIKKSILESFENNRSKCFDQIKIIKLVTERMYTQPEKDNASHKNDISEALLRNISGTKIHRLAKYTGLKEEEIRSGKVTKELDRKAIEEISNFLTVPESYDEKWWRGVAKSRDLVVQQLPVESLPLLLDAIIKWGDKEWTFYWEKEAILLIEKYYTIHGFTVEQRNQVRTALGNFIKSKSDVNYFNDSVNIASRMMQKLK